MTADTWDFMRAGGWDVPPGERLPTLLAYLGVPDSPLPEQQAALAAWMEGAAFHGAPEYLKQECRSFLEKQPQAAQPAPSAPVPPGLAKWQAKLDAMFPGGVIVTWNPTTTVPVPWVQVEAMHGLDPSLVFYHPGWTKNEKVLISLEQGDAPHLWRARFTDGSQALLCAKIPDGLAGPMAKERADLIAGNPLKLAVPE